MEVQQQAEGEYNEVPLDAYHTPSEAACQPEYNPASFPCDSYAGLQVVVSLGTACKLLGTGLGAYLEAVRVDGHILEAAE